MEGRKGKYVNWNTPTEVVGSKAEDRQGIQLPKGVGRNGTKKSSTRKTNFKYTEAIKGASYTDPKSAD